MNFIRQSADVKTTSKQQENTNEQQPITDNATATADAGQS